MEGSQRQLSAIMFSDIVGYSKLMGDDEQGTLALLQEHNDLLIPIIQRHGGSILKFIGDALLCSFESATEAVKGAVEIQQALAARNKGAAKKLLVRIGIHIGDVLRKDGDVFGDGVNIAARIQPLAEPGGICISQTVYHVVQAHPELRMVSLGQRHLKNIKEPIGIYEVSSGTGRPFRFPWRALGRASAAVALAGCAALALILHRARGSAPRFRAGEFGVLVLPLHGMDAETDKDGRLLQSMAGQRLDQLLRWQSGIQIISRWTPPAPRNINSALDMGKRSGATAVLWGEVLSIGGHLQAQAYLSAVPGSGFNVNLAPPPFEAAVGGSDSVAGREEIAKKIANMAILAAAHHFEKDSDRALALLGEVQPPTAASLTAQGNVYLGRRNLPEAQAAYEKAIGLDKGFARAHLGLGRALNALHKEPEAAAEFQKAAEFDPALDAPRWELGLLYQSQAQYEKALEEFKRAAALNQKTVPARQNLANLCDLLGHPDEAQEQFRWLLINSPRPEDKLQVGLLYYLSLLRQRQSGQANLAVRGLMRHQDAGWPVQAAFFLAGKIDEKALLDAVEAAGEPKDLTKRQCQAYYYLGEKLALNGNPRDAARARDYFQKAVKTGRRNLLEFTRAQFELQRGPKEQKPRGRR